MARRGALGPRTPRPGVRGEAPDLRFRKLNRSFLPLPARPREAGSSMTVEASVAILAQAAAHRRCFWLRAASLECGGHFDRKDEFFCEFFACNHHGHASLPVRPTPLRGVAVTFVAFFRLRRSIGRFGHPTVEIGRA